MIGALLVVLADAPPPPVEPCPADMQLVVGRHYENVERVCLRFSQDTCWEYLPWLAAYEGRETPIAVCMDRFEWPNREGELPPVMMRFTEAEASCRAVGKRLCTEFEWETACEGPDVLPFGYGHAFEPGRCVNDKPYKSYDAGRLASRDDDVRDEETRRLYQAEPTGSRARCASAFGVHDLLGNVEEWVRTSRPEWPYDSSLKGGYWAKPRSACRGTNDSHAPSFRFYEIGFRCCKDLVRPRSIPPHEGDGRASYDASLHSRSPFMIRTSLVGRSEIASSTWGAPAMIVAEPLLAAPTWRWTARASAAWVSGPLASLSP
jgi:hypothetical protein